MKALNKNLFPSGGINIESIVNETKKEVKNEKEKDIDNNNEEIVINGEDKSGAVDMNFSPNLNTNVNTNTSIPDEVGKKLTRVERKEIERRAKKVKKDTLKEIRKGEEIRKKKEELEKIKSNVKDEIKKSQFSDNDVKRIERILFNLKDS